ncbi:hypothetical protein SuNHUV7_02060 (plasmid) [Pseudoseohaeicola sp. NH-UV-7]|uniref:DMT family transporter n=1 Tax=Sulfitobacter sp. TBRI5 TaxID=2989732 RepID=UPI003A70F843
MTTHMRLFFIAILVLLGVGWGATIPMMKLAVSTGHQHFGLIFWQLVIGATLMAGLSRLRGRGLPLGRAQIKTYLVIALIGTVIPNSASYQAIAHLPAGVMSILLSLIPMLAFPMALALGQDQFNTRRFCGLLFGLAGVMVLILPEASLPDRSAIWWVMIAVASSICYAFEGNYVARWGTAGLDPIEVLFGASVVGALIALPLALGSGQWINPFIPYGVAEWALIGSSLIHVLVYAGYVWLVGKAGPVFAVQVSYLVTGFGVIWSLIVLNESYSPYIWMALALMFAGLFLVQPRPKAILAPAKPMGDNAL